MDLVTFYDLLSPAGQEVLSAAMDLEPRNTDFLPHFQTLCRQFPRNLARAALGMAILRGEATSKFLQADKMYFTHEALQQASGYVISSYRAGRYSGFDQVFDLGCSIGGDALNLAEVTSICGVDHDPLRLAMAQANFTALNNCGDFILADLTEHLPVSLRPNTALFFDPARRANNRRIITVDQYLPPLSIVNKWLPVISALGVKISPGVKLDELAEYDAEIEFISLKGELKEAVLWFGPLKTTKRRAMVQPGAYTLTGDPLLTLPERILEPLAFLYEPDPAVLRAGLVRNLAVQLNAYQLDPDIAYLTTDKIVDTPFARVWEIENWFPFRLKQLRAYLRERSVGQVTVKKRGSPLQPESLIRDLRLKGDAERVVFLTHLRGRPIVMVCYPND